ncbi:MAG: cation:proton antiporter [Thermoleophilia bacterium]
MSAHEVAGWAGFALTCTGVLFFTAGTVGLLRFPDALARLHGLAKADNLGIGFVAIGLVLQADSPAAAVKLLIIWGLVLLAGATCTYLIASAVRRGQAGVDRD